MDTDQLTRHLIDAADDGPRLSVDVPAALRRADRRRGRRRAAAGLAVVVLAGGVTAGVNGLAGPTQTIARPAAEPSAEPSATAGVPEVLAAPSIDVPPTDPRLVQALTAMTSTGAGSTAGDPEAAVEQGIVDLPFGRVVTSLQAVETGSMDNEKRQLAWAGNLPLEHAEDGWPQDTLFVSHLDRLPSYDGYRVVSATSIFGMTLSAPDGSFTVTADDAAQFRVWAQELAGRL